MADLQLDNTLDIFIDKSGDIAYATGREAFEQEISIALIDYWDGVVGESDRDTALERVRVGARRAVNKVNLIDRLAGIDARFKKDEPNTIEVDVFFDTGEVLSFEGTDDGTAGPIGSRVFDDGVFEDVSSMDIYDDGELQ